MSSNTAIELVRESTSIFLQACPILTDSLEHNLIWTFNVCCLVCWYFQDKLIVQFFFLTAFYIFITNGQGPWSQVEKNYLNGKLKAITAYFNTSAVDNKSAWSLMYWWWDQMVAELHIIWTWSTCYSGYLVVATAYVQFCKLFYSVCTIL